MKNRWMILIALMMSFMLLPVIPAAADDDAQRQWDLSCSVKVGSATSSYTHVNGVLTATGTIAANTYCKVDGSFRDQSGMEFYNIAYMENSQRKTTIVQASKVVGCLYLFAASTGLSDGVHELLAGEGSISKNDGSLAEPSGSGNSGGQPVSCIKYVKTEDGGANLYVYNSETSSVIAYHKNGTAVSVISDGGSWAAVVINDQNGYIRSAALSSSKPSAVVEPAAREQTTMYVRTGNTGGLYMRRNANTSAIAIGLYPNGTKVTVYSRYNGWAYLRVEDGSGKFGYMMLKYLNEDPDAPVPGSEENETELESSRIMYVTATADQPVYLTYSTSAQHKTLGEYYNGQQVTVLSTTDNWAYVRVDGKTGYMLTEYLKDSFSKPAGTDTVIATLYVSVEDGLLKLRKSPGASAAIIGKYFNGTPVNVHAYTNSTWAYVTVKGQTGYMMRKYLTGTAPGGQTGAPAGGDESESGTPSENDPSAASVTMVVKTGNDGKLHLRKSANTGSASLGKYVNGAAVTVHSTVNGWAHVTVGGKTGYMMLTFLAEPSAGGEAGQTEGENVTQENTAGSDNSSQASGTMVVRTANDGKLHLRKSANTSAMSLGKYANGEAVTVHSTANGWAHVTVGGNMGYMMLTFLAEQSAGDDAGQTESENATLENTAEQDNSSAASGTMVVKTGNDGKLHLRRTASTSSVSLGKYANGAQVTVHAISGEWARVTVDGKSGYMMLKFLSE